MKCKHCRLEIEPIISSNVFKYGTVGSEQQKGWGYCENAIAKRIITNNGTKHEPETKEDNIQNIKQNRQYMKRSKMIDDKPRIGHLSFISYRKDLDSPIIYIGKEYLIDGHPTLSGLKCKIISIDCYISQTDSQNRVVSSRCWPGVDLYKSVPKSHTINGKLSKSTGYFINSIYLKSIEI